MKKGCKYQSRFFKRAESSSRFAFLRFNFRQELSTRGDTKLQLSVFRRPLRELVQVNWLIWFWSYG